MKLRNRSQVLEIKCETWRSLLQEIDKAHNLLNVEEGECLWFRGSADCNYSLSPSLMRETEGRSKQELDWIEQDLFFEFQARSSDLRLQGLSDWECLFYGRHFDLPTRVLDWTDTVGIAVYFAVESKIPGPKRRNVTQQEERVPAIWALNPFALNERTWEVRDIVSPKYLGWNKKDGEYWDFGELLVTPGPWPWKRPVAIYPIQISERVRAQTGWFTIHGNKRQPLDLQLPGYVIKFVLQPECVREATEFLKVAGLNCFSIYRDLDNLALWLRQTNLPPENLPSDQQARVRY